MARSFPLLALLAAGCMHTNAAEEHTPPVPGAQRVDELIQEGETHFASLWKLTSGGENAEAYWSFAGDRLSLQRRNPEEGVDCDQIYVTGEEEGGLVRVSTGRGVTTCAYFLPGDEEVLFASTHAEQEGCPPPPDYSQGYVWTLHPEYEIWVRKLGTEAFRRLTESPGYDAEATISPRGDRMVFTSTRSGDLELWTSDLDGSDLRQVTRRVGYDGGAFFSHDGKRLVFRSTEFTPGAEEAEQADYKRLLAMNKVRPSRMEIWISDADGGNLRRVTTLGGANFAPYFFPDDERVVFASNHHEKSARNFDLFAIGTDGYGLERITTYDGFDSFPMFSPDGRWMAFSSNRGGSREGETNVFIAEWRE